MDLEQFSENLKQHHLREGVELLATMELATGEVWMQTRLEDGEVTTYTILVQDVACIQSE